MGQHHKESNIAHDCTWDNSAQQTKLHLDKTADGTIVKRKQHCTKLYKGQQRKENKIAHRQDCREGKIATKSSSRQLANTSTSRSQVLVLFTKRRHSNLKATKKQKRERKKFEKMQSRRKARATEALSFTLLLCTFINVANAQSNFLLTTNTFIYSNKQIRLMSGQFIVTVRKMIYIVCFCIGAPRIGKDGRPLLNKPKVVLPIIITTTKMIIMIVMLMARTTIIARMMKPLLSK